MKKIIFVSAIVGLSLFACKKDQAAAAGTKATKSSEASSKTLRCSPWQDEADMQTAIDDLNSIVPCNTSTCRNGSPLHTEGPTTVVVQNSSFTDLEIPVTSAGDLATQNYIWNWAVNTAINYPHSTGFTLSGVNNFRLVFHSAPRRISWYTVEFGITFIQCGN